MKKALAIGGEPASGKTTLVQTFLKGRPFERRKFGLLRYWYIPSLDLAVLGTYEGSTFDGTDRLSMAVQNDATTFVEARAYNLLFEGDRLFNKTFLAKLARLYSTEVWVLSIAESVSAHRHHVRRDGQSEVFIRGRRTKINNIVSVAEPSWNLRVIANENVGSLERLAAGIAARFD